MGQYKPEQHHYKRSRFGAVVVVLLLALILWQAVAAGVRYVAYLRLDMTTAQTAHYTEQIEAQLLLIRSETLITAPCEGEFVPALADGERVSVGGTIGYMQTGQQKAAVSSPTGGLVFYALDGWEEKLSPAAADSIDWSQTLTIWEGETVAATIADAQELANLAAGRNVAKVIDNLVQPACFIYAEQYMETLAQDGMLTFSYAETNGDTEQAYRLRLRIDESGQLDDGRSFARCAIADNDGELYTKRHISGTILGDTVSGVVVPAEAVFVDNHGQHGVYVAAGRYVEFRSVTVEGRYDDMVMVDGVDEGERVVSHPEVAKEGQRVYN